jgi:hypothetical protein
VFLTRNEVQFAREQNFTALFIVHSIDLTTVNGVPVASGGEVREISPWDIAKGELTPLAFSYRPQRS